MTAATALLAFATLIAQLPEQLLAAATRLLDTLLRTSLQGGLVIGAIWLLCRVAPRMPAGVRAGLWWLAGLQLLVGLAWPRPIALPVLPARAEVAWATQATQSTRTAQPGQGARPTTARAIGAPLTFATDAIASATRVTGADAAAGTRAIPGTSAGAAAAGDSSVSSFSLTSAPASASASASQRGDEAARRNEASQAGATRLTGVLARISAAVDAALRIGPLPLVGLWLGVAGWRLLRLARLRRRLAALVARAAAAPADVQRVLDRLCDRVAPWQTPGLRVSDEVEMPQVCGARHPVILLPRRMLARLSADELSMTLYHELTHVTRGDLWLGWIPAIARELFFFHPLAALAAREYGVAREAACDAAVIHRLDAEPHDYGRLLVTLGVTSPRATRHAPLAAAGSASSVRLLKRRLVMLQQLPIRPGHARAWWTLTALALVSIVPVQLVGQRVRPVEAQPSATTVAPGSSIAGPVTGVAGGIGGGVAGGVVGGVAGGVQGGGPGGGIGRVTATAGDATGAGVGPSVSAGVGSGVGSGSAGGAGAGTGSGSGAGAGSGGGAGAGSGVGSAASVAGGVGIGTIAQVARAGDDVITGRIVNGRDDEDGSRPWVMLRGGRNVSMNGSSRDVARARTYQKQADEPLLWFRRDGQEYIVRDPALLEQLIELFKPMEELGRQQGELGERQGALGREQGALGAKQGELGEQQGRIGARQGRIAAERALVEARRAVAEAGRDGGDTADAERRRTDAARLNAEAEAKEREMSREQDTLGARQNELGHQQDALGRKQDELGRQQEALGRLQEEASRRADIGIKALMQKAITSGAAQKVP